MVVMLRTLGIPARLVNGFQTGSYNRVGQDFVVRARDAHSWVEVNFPQYGWISFDPTPADPNPLVPGTLDDYLDAAGLFWNEWVINYDFFHQVRLVSELEQDSHRYYGDAAGARCAFNTSRFAWPTASSVARGPQTDGAAHHDRRPGRADYCGKEPLTR